MAGYSQQVKLQFMADTSQPQKQLQQLAIQLKQISDLQTENLGINQGINQAVKSAETLQRVLQKAVNTDTGKLNMNTFVAELNKANTTVTQLSQNLIAAGPAGARAFQGLAASIAQAEMPIKKMNATLQGMLTSLANTVKWQISSSAVHGMMSGFSSAVGYVKDLNRSLNDIRIVTGQSVDDMARFAEQANKAAKALSTTTKAYSDASLIYYQQGDSQEMAAKKAAITIKAANASFGSSTKEMSEYLTAVWNSYQVGAEELERYVDIMAALGAKTATSLEEIATSMQKVAATANTVGVSMEQVSSIISTVSSVTRESAESIGTSYKTIFARMGDLKLGKTDDGVGLGQVSSQLKSIGVQVLDATGNLRDMGDIITDLGNKWQTMSAAQKTATAQIVAGKRQYTQLMALFENWNMYNQNMSIATNAEGELQQMADIYAESWEAASARVRASWEGVWDSLLNDEALIKMTNGLADVVSGIESVVDGFGGLPGVIAQVASVITTVFQTKIASSINGVIGNIQNFASSFQGIAGVKGKIKTFFTESTFQRNTNRSINELQDLNKQQQATHMKQGTYIGDEAIQMRMADNLLQKKQELLRVEKSLSEAQVLAAKESINDLNTQINKVNELIQRKQQQTTDVATVKRNIVRQYSAAGEFTDADGNVIQRQQALNDLVTQEGTAFSGLNATMDAVMTKYQQLSTASASALSVFENGRNILDNYNNSLKKGIAPAEASKTAIAQLKTTLDGLWKEFQEGQSSIPEALLKSWQRTFTEISKAPAGSDAQKMAFQRLIASMQEYSNYAEKDMVRAQQTLSQKLGIPIANLQNMDAVIDILIQTMRELGFEVTKTGEKMTKMKGFGAGGGIGKAISQLVSGLSAALSSFSSISSAVANWDDSTLTSKITSIGSAVTNIGMQLASGNWIGAIASGIGAGIGWLVGEMEKAEKKAKELRENFIEELDQNLESSKTENSSIQTLIQNFNTLYAQKQQGLDVDNQLAEAASKLAEKYNITGAAVANLTGNYDELITKLQLIATGQWDGNNTNNGVDQAVEQARINFEEAKTRVETHSAVQQETLGFKTGSTSVHYTTFSLNGANTRFGENKDERTETIIISAEQQRQIDRLKQKGYRPKEDDKQIYVSESMDSIGHYINTYQFGDTKATEKLLDAGQNKMTISFWDLLQQYDQKNNTNIRDYFINDNGYAELLTGGTAQFQYTQYSELKDLISYMEHIGIDMTSGYGGGLKTWLRTIQPEMTAYETAIQEYGSAFVNKETSRFIGKTANNDYSFEKFFQDYNDVYQNFYTVLKNTYGDSDEVSKMAKEAADSTVDLNSGLNSYSTALKAAYEVYGDLSTAGEALINLTNDGVDAANIDVAILKAWKSGNTEYLNAIVNSRKAQQHYMNTTSVYHGAEEGLSLLKEDMSFEEMGQLYDAFEWGQGDIIAWNSFYAMSYEDKTAYLESLSEQYLTTSREAAKNARIAAETEETEAIKTRNNYITQATQDRINANNGNGMEWVQYHNSLTAGTVAGQEMLDSYMKFMAEPGRSYDDWVKQYFLEMVDYDAIKDASYESFKNLWVKDDQDGQYKIKKKADGTEIELNDEQRAMMNEYNQWVENNAGKSVMDFVAEKQSEGAGGFSQEVIDEYNRLVAEAYAAGEQVDEALRQEALWTAMGMQVDSVATKIQKLSKALSQLPTNAKDLQKIADLLYNGDVGLLMRSSDRSRALQALDIVDSPRAKTSPAFKSYKQYVIWAQEYQKTEAGKNYQILNQDDYSPYTFSLPEGEDWDDAQDRLLDITMTNKDFKDYGLTEITDWADYLEQWTNYDTIMGSIIDTLNVDASETVEQLKLLEEEYQSFAETGKLTDKQQNALELLGIDPNTITDIDSYRNAINLVKNARQEYAATLKTNLMRYDDGFETELDWDQLDPSKDFNEFLSQQLSAGLITDEDFTVLLQSTNFKKLYEQWRQAAVEANDTGVDFDAIDAQIKLSQATATSASELKKLKTAAEEAKTAVDLLNGALGKTEPISAETSMRLEQLGLDISSWGDGTGEGALKAYGRVLGHSTMAQIETLQHQRSKESDRTAILGRWDAATELGDQRGWSTGLVKMGKDERAKLFDEMGLSAPVVTEIERMVEEAEKAGRELTWSDILQGLQDYDEDLIEQMDIIWAQFEDSGVKAVQAILQAEQAAAQQTVQIWKTACQAILAAKQGIAEGKSIGESLMGSDGQMAAIIAIALGQNMTPEQIKTMLSGGDSQAWQTVANAGPNFDAATYATAQGGQTQFLYNSNGVMAGSASELYTNASVALGDHWTDFLSQLTETELASYNAAKEKAQTEGVAFDGKQWLLDYLFPGWKNADGTFTSKAADDYNRSRGTVLEGEWTAEMKQARTELDAARTTFNRTYQEETANINDWQAIHDAAVTSQQTGQSIYDILGKDQAAGIMARLGMTQEQLNAQTVETATAAINASVANINAAKVEFTTTTNGIENIETLGTAKADAQEEVGEQIATTTNVYGNATWVPTTPPKGNGPQAVTADGEVAMTLNTTNGYNSVAGSITSMAKAYNMSESAMKDYIRAVNNITDENTVLTQAHLNVATAAMRQQAGIDMATESLDGYIRTIKKGDTDSVSYIKSLEGMRSIYKELYNLTDEQAALLSDDFLTNADNMALLQRAMAGDQEAWTQLQGNYNTAHSTQIAAGTLTTQNGALIGDTSAGSDKDFTNKISKIQHEAQLLEQEMEALNSIDITEMPMAGTAAYEALSASLQKAGKSMSDYAKMSQKERAQALGDAKVAKLREQKIKNAELIQAYENKYDFENANYTWDNAVADNATAEYQAYLDAKQRELELNQEIADTQQETQDQINEIGAQDAEARIAILEAEREIVQETVDAYTELADIMMRAAETGKLTAEEILKIQKLDKNLLTSWNNATTYAERVNVAAQARLKAMTQEVTTQQEAIDGMTEARILIAKKGIDSTSIYKNTSFADENAFKTLMSQHLSAAGLDAVMKAWQTVNSKMTSTSTLTDFYNELEAELARMEAEGVEGIEEIKATAQDAMAEMYGDLGEYEVSMAQTVVDTWLNAFKQIAEARKQLIMGEDIGDSLTESWESYLSLAQAYGDGSLWTAYRSGALKPGDLKYQSETKLIEGLRDSMGMSTVNTPGKNLFDNNGNLLLGDALGDALGMEKTATRTVKVEVVDAQGNKSVKWQEQAAYDEAAILEYAAPYLKELMTNYGDLYTGTDSIDALVEKALAGDPAALAWIKKAYNWMDQTTKDYATAVKEDAKLAEVQATYDAKVQELTEQRDKAKLGASATDLIQDTKESERTADTVAAALQQAGISPEAYMAMLREKGYDVKTLDDVAKLTDAQLEAVETSLEQDALAAGQAIISAAQIFHAIVTSGGDEAALNAKLEALGVTRDANGNIQGFGQYQGAGLNYGENTVAGQQASDNVTEATEEQNTLKNEYDVNQTEDVNTKITRAAELADMSMEELREYADYLRELGEINGETEEQNLLLAASYARIQKGLKSVQNNLKTYTKTLKDSTKGTVEHKKALDDMRGMYADVLDLDDKGMKALTEDFMTQEDVLKDLEDAANGVDGAYDSLQEKATKHILDNLTDDADISSMSDEIATLSTAINQLPEGQVLDWSELLGQGSIGQAVASNLSSLASFVNGLASSASEASSIMQALAAALGMDMEIEQKDFDVTQYEWQASAGGAVGYGPDGSQVYVPLNVEAIPVEGTVTGWSIKTITNKGTYGGGVKGGSKGGGGGGNKKPKQAKKIKFEDEIDRYHEVNQRLERMGELLDKIDKYKARAFGKGYLKNLEQESKMLKAQQAMYKRKMEEAKLYYEQDSANMASKYGATFDEYGNMSNYDEVLAGIIADENRKIDYYNSLSAAEQEKLDEQYEHDGGYIAYIAKMREDFKKDLANMEESAATMAEAENNWEEIINQLSALKLEEITYKAEYQMELNDADRKLLQFYVDRYEDDVNKQAESFEKLVAQGAELVADTELLKQKQEELNAAYAAGEITEADYAEGLQATRDALLENAEALLELEKNVKDFYGNTLEMINDAFQEQVDHITAATDAMQSYINILGLMGKGQNYSEKALFYGQRAEFAQQEAIAKKAHLDLLLNQKAEFDALIASGQELSDVQKQWYADLLNAIDDANAEFLDSVETALTYLQEKYENAANKISEDLDKALAGAFGSLEHLSDAYSYYTETQDRYVSSARELYEVSKLNRDIEMSIEDATTSASKKMLKDLKDRINAQSELNKLTEYDIEMNRLQYELALAKIGLEEAQNAKDTVRLTRDESGNYVYQYTADNDKINEAQQTYEDKLQEINDLALERQKELEQGMIDSLISYKEQHYAIMTNMNLTDEERAALLAELNARYEADMNYYAEQMGIATANLTESNATIMRVYSDDLRTVSMTTRDGINEDIAKIIENKDQAIESFRQAVTDATTLSSEHQKAIDAFTSQTVGDYTAMSNAAIKYGDDVDRAMGKAEEAVGTSTDAMLDKIRELGASWEGFIDGPLDAFIDGIIELAEEIQDTLHWLAELETETATTPNPGPEPPTNTDPTPQEPTDDNKSPVSPSPGGGNPSPGSQKPTTPTTVSLIINSESTSGMLLATSTRSGLTPGVSVSPFAFMPSTPSGYSYKSCSPSSNFNLPMTGSATITYTYTPKGGGSDSNSTVLDKKPSSQFSMTRMATGGLADFTGPAFLDGTFTKPELVLNPTDTQNMLQTVQSLRELDTDSITMLLSALGAATASLFGALNGNYHASGVTTSNMQELNQNVEIHADFPNVTDRNEIMEAIDGLVNRASQFVQKKMW